MIKSKLIQNINENGHIHVSIDSIIDEMLCGNKVTNVCVDNSQEYKDVERYIEACRTYSKKPSMILHKCEDEHLLSELAENWVIPSEYKRIDVIEYLISRCKNEEEIQRVSDELLEYHKRNQLIILNVMIYLVDTMRKNNVVWGIGRGSSVASFCLYLIGINKINPMDYDIPYTEFFK